MNQSYAPPSKALRPLRAFVIMDAEPVESLTPERESRGVYPWVFMDADRREDICRDYGMDEAALATEGLRIVPSGQVPETCVRGMMGHECHFIGAEAKSRILLIQ